MVLSTFFTRINFREIGTYLIRRAIKTGQKLCFHGIMGETLQRKLKNLFHWNRFSRISLKDFFRDHLISRIFANSRKSRKFLDAKISDIKVDHFKRCRTRPEQSGLSQKCVFYRPVRKIT